MNIKKTLICALVLAAAVLSAGCVEREIVKNQEEIVPDFSIKDDIEIDWEQAREDCEAALEEDEYPYGKYIDFEVDEEGNAVRVIWPLNEGSPKEAAPEYGEALIRALNDAIAVQDFKYALSSQESYGGYWELHDVKVEVFDDSDILFPDNYYVNDTIPAGSNKPVELAY